MAAGLNKMMTSSYGNIFCVTGHLCGEFTVNSPHKGQWHGALMFSLICARINGRVNNCEAGDLIRHRAHYYVTVMKTLKNHWPQHSCLPPLNGSCPSHTPKRKITEKGLISIEISLIISGCVAILAMCSERLKFAEGNMNLAMLLEFWYLILDVNDDFVDETNRKQFMLSIYISGL